MKKILITGSNGLLGQKLVYTLLNSSEFNVIATSVGENRLIKKEGYEYQTLDITDKKQVEKVFTSTLPDVVINTAAMTNVDACESQQEACWKLNVTAVQNIVDVLTSLQSKNKDYKPHLIHLSTDFIFDGTAGPYREEDKPNPLSYYAKSKLESEKVVQASVLKWSIARTIIVYGVVDNMSRTNIVLWAKDSLTKNQKINIVDDQFRSPTLAEDLAQGCILMAQKEAEGVFNISGKETFSVLELVNRVADYFGLDKSLVTPIKSDTLNQAAKRPPVTGFVISKAVRELGYTPHSFEEGLAILESQLN